MRTRTENEALNKEDSMKINKTIVMMLLVSTIVTSLSVNSLISIYVRPVNVMFYLILSISLIDGIFVAYFNKVHLLGMSSIHAWLYGVVIVLISLLVAFGIDIVHTGRMIKNPDYLAFLFIMVFMGSAIVVISVSYWLTFIVMNKLIK